MSGRSPLDLQASRLIRKITKMPRKSKRCVSNEQIKQPRTRLPSMSTKGSTISLVEDDDKEHETVQSFATIGVRMA